MTLTELMRLQAMNPTRFKINVPFQQVGHQIGNAMSKNVIERILVRALTASGLIAPQTLRDTWESGEAQKDLLASVGKGFPDIRTV